MTNESSSEDVRKLWQSQNAEERYQMSVEEIRKNIHEVDRKIRRRNFGGYAACFVVLVVFGFFFFIPGNLTQRLGSILTMLGTGYLAYQIHQNQLTNKSDVSNAAMGNLASSDFYRAELERQRDFHRGIRFWSRLLAFAPGPIVFAIGMANSHPEIAKGARIQAVVFLVLALLAIPLNLWESRKYQKRIDELNALQRKQS